MFQFEFFYIRNRIPQFENGDSCQLELTMARIDGAIDTVRWFEMCAMVTATAANLLINTHEAQGIEEPFSFVFGHSSSCPIRLKVIYRGKFV